MQIKLLIYILLVVGMLYFVQSKYNLFEIQLDSEKGSEQQQEQIEKVEILNEDGRSIFVEVEVADTAELRKEGLSGRSMLGDYQGMLLVMENEELHSIWMKDMEISLDLLFINSSGYVVYIAEDQKPCTQVCESVKSPYEAKYVLEVKSGFVEINRVRVGNEVKINILSES
jgi:uncharacterized membrane protein (UPF0127 family)